MKFKCGLILGVFVVNCCAFASNWEKSSGKPGQKCIPSYTLNMKPVEKIDPKHIKVSQKSFGHAESGVVTLKKENPDMFGEGFLDIGVQKTGTKGGVDQWKECKIQ